MCSVCVSSFFNSRDSRKALTEALPLSPDVEADQRHLNMKNSTSGSVSGNHGPLTPDDPELPSGTTFFMYPCAAVQRGLSQAGLESFGLIDTETTAGPTAIEVH